MSSPLSPSPAPANSPTVAFTASPPHPVSSSLTPASETQPSSSSPLSPPATGTSPAMAGKSSPSSRVPTTGSSESRGERLPFHVSHRSPPLPSSSPSPSPASSLSQAVVVGLAAGGVVILLVLSIACLCCFSKKPQRPRPPPLPFYFNDAPSPTLPVKDHSYEQYQIWHNAPPPADQVVKIASNPPLPSFAPSLPHHPVHFHPPPPPPLVPSNSEGSGSSYSGSDNPPPPLLPGFALGFSKSAFTYEELAMATDGFSDANLLGQGGFGYVHRGMLPNCTEVAVKQLKSGSGQGEREFQTEVEIISRVHHKHLVSLVGYCIADGKRLLVYEFIPNNTLEFHLHEKGRPPLDWPTRLKIALGSAKGLAYLHEDCHPKIIHRDIKASNILLDFKFEPKVADFGLAKIASEVNTYVSTRVIGTFGYLAPEYASTGKLTDKSDVFSFGVMLLELITGRRPYDSTQSIMDDSLVDWARPLLARALDDANFSVIVDPRLGEYNRTEMRSMVACAAFAVRHSAKRRPRMSQIVRALEGDAFFEHLNEGVKPGKSGPFASYCGSDYDAMQYNEDIKKFRKMALGSHEYGDSGYSELTSEYGQLRSASSSSEGQQTQEMEMIVGKKGKPTAYQ